jgi:uncharacterized protein
MNTRQAVRLLVAALAAFVLVFSTRSASAGFTPPPFTSSVVDAAGKLSESDRAYLTNKIEQQRLATGFVVAVFLPASLDGAPIEDVAYETARAWKLGQAGKDNGVLLVIAPAERRVRIETGKGVGGALTDLQSNQIIRQRIGPALKQDRFREGIDGGIDGIYAALASEGSPVAKHAHGQKQGVPILVLLLFAGPVIIIILVAIGRARRGGGYGYDGGYGGGPIFFGGGGGGSDWSSGGGSGGGSDWGGGGSSDYGGGGDFGGGGSSDSY